MNSDGTDNSGTERECTCGPNGACDICGGDDKTMTENPTDDTEVYDPHKDDLCVVCRCTPEKGRTMRPIKRMPSVENGHLCEVCEGVWFDTPDDEPEYVGVYADPIGDVCGHWIEGDEGMERCGEPATHTTVMRTHRTVELASCDKHATPEHAGKCRYTRNSGGEFNAK